MIKRIVEISEHPAHLRVRRKQLEILHEGEVLGRVSCEDLGILIIDHPRVTYSHQAMTTLSSLGAVVILCDDTHHPVATVLPVANHSQVVTRLQLQVEASQPTKKRIWKQIIKAKIARQAENLSDSASCKNRLEELSRTVRSGDPKNHEAQAARLYWGEWLNDLPESVEFKRERYGSAPNNLLNYGYAIYRAVLARSIVAAGLNPALGVKHSHRSNVFCLADDLIEPLRPYVDASVRMLFASGHQDLDRYTKSALLEILTETFSSSTGEGPLLVVLNRYVASFVRCLENSQNDLEIPEKCTLPDTETCGLL